jgi:hypothetical protein
MKEAKENYARMMEYERGEISDYGVVAKAEIGIRLPEIYGDQHIETLETIKSGGVWGFPSDDMSEAELEEDRQLSELRAILKALHATIPKGLEVVRP